MSESLRSLAQASLHRAMLGEVTPDLRAVALANGDNWIRARFIYEPPATETISETVDDIEAEMMADLHEGQEVECRWETLAIADLPRLCDAEYWAYRRRER